MMTYQTVPQYFSTSSHQNAPVKPLVNKPAPYYSQQQGTAQQQQHNSISYEDGPLCRAMMGWIAEDAEALTFANAQHYLKLIREIMVLINPHAVKDNLLLSAVFYADRFVQRRGVKLEEPRKAFLVLLISALVTIKMWEDFEVKTETLQRYTGISKKQISVLERQFLGVLEYSLCYSYEEMVSFQIQWCFPQAPVA
jgi:hypothetical protein